MGSAFAQTGVFPTYVCSSISEENESTARHVVIRVVLFSAHHIAPFKEV
jgi:hypothetical protein